MSDSRTSSRTWVLVVLLLIGVALVAAIAWVVVVTIALTSAMG